MIDPEINRDLRDLLMTEMRAPFTQRAALIAREFDARARGEFAPTQTAEFRSARPVVNL
ncbi:hypothetical protein NFX46_28790 [Streptomyces phaeoluteigriseus]|uniref:Uncharacterized protein n=1 Tax=Streptomyces phaeoluteigriseus TaxID=114686 RepID=A0ABY4ZFN8_9ACTN|nr:hypothetical protein [Streptomyces phaeoluteigriseus]USQ87363.1 hypothetical protein NFX46_28790 [Streptomyces phaeoluteigriseus]